MFSASLPNAALAPMRQTLPGMNTRHLFLVGYDISENPAAAVPRATCNTMRWAGKSRSMNAGSLLCRYRGPQLPWRSV